MKTYLKKFVVYLLEKESILILKKYKPKIVAITGTVGKTSTKDAIYAAISPFVIARKSPKSFNSELGVPLTIFGSKNPGTDDVVEWCKVLMHGVDLIILPNHFPEWLVLEVGTDRPGDIAAITKWLRPDIVVVTKLADVPVHVEAFETPEKVFEEKGNLVKALKPEGILVLNGDDEKVLQYRALTSGKVIIFGLGDAANIKADHYEIMYEEKMPLGCSFEVKAKDVAVQVKFFDTLGRQHIYHVLAAAAVAELLGIDMSKALKVFSRERPTPGRMRLIEGIQHSLIIDDTYNSSPIALEEALNTLEEVKAKRKIAVLGDMLELGTYSLEEHKKAGEHARKVVDELITVGVRSRHMEGTHQFDSARQAGEFLKDVLKEGDVVLVKGSQGVRMERVVEMIMAHPEEKKKLLVRQDKEWERRL